MGVQIHVKRGKAIIDVTGLRCMGIRPKQSDQYCHKLLVRKTSTGQVAGEFKCDRCNQIIEVEVK